LETTKSEEEEVDSIDEEETVSASLGLMVRGVVRRDDKRIVENTRAAGGGKEKKERKEGRKEGVNE
jgi:hypothetical protein